MADSLSAETHRLMDDFDKALELHAVSEKCFGRNGLDEEVPFTTKRFLVNYWTHEHVKRLLLSFSERHYVARDIPLILKEYTAVFSILTKLRKSDWIRKFLTSQIKDSDLPLRDSSMPKFWTDQENYRELWKDFINEQWRFCPYTFGRLSDAELPESYILPIQRKVCLQSKADKGELAILYRVTLHPAFQSKLSEYVVFKEYQRTDSIASITYDNEVSIYTTLKPNSTASKNIIEYYGSFQTLGKRTIMLEYATSGDLLTFLQNIEPPSNMKHLTVFWTNFFELLLGLEAVHNLEPPTDDKDSWFLEGVHQDIRAPNVLLIPKPSRRPYEYTFKLVDFGTGYIKKQSLDHLRQKHGDNMGNAIYSSPESINDRLYPESDVWALGALASEILIWTIKGWSGVQDYFNLRRGMGQILPGLEESHYGCFHDGIGRLPVIEALHHEILKDKQPDDEISAVVSQFILEHMLVEYPSNPAGDTSKPRFRRGAKQTYRLWQQKLSAMSSTSKSPVGDIDPSIDEPSVSDIGSSSKEVPVSDIRNGPRHSATEPVPVTSATETFPTQPSQSDHDLPGRVTRYSSLSAENPRYSLQESFGHPIHVQNSVHRGPSQARQSRSSNWQSDDDPDMMPAQVATPKLDRSYAIEYLMKELDIGTEDQDTQHAASHSYNRSATVQTLHHNFIVPKDKKSAKGKAGAMLSRLAGSSKDEDDLFKAYPRLETAVGKLKNSGNSGREQVFIIDDSESMSPFKDAVAMTVRVLAYLIKKGDVDPDRSIELYFASQIGRKNENSKSKPLEDAVRKWKFDDLVCEMGTALEYRLLSLLPDGSTPSPKPISVYVLTNGLWNPAKPASLCGVDEAIEKALLRLDESKVQVGKRWLGIQFIGFYSDDPFAEIGRRRLKFLDDKLCELLSYVNPNLERRDVVDTRKWDDNIEDILLGAVSDSRDERKSGNGGTGSLPSVYSY